MKMVHPLARVLGHGSAKAGVHHWWGQRITAVALVPLTLWVVAKLLGAGELSYVQATAWLGSPWNAALMIGWLLAMMHHAQLGLQVIIEDYVHSPGAEWTLLILVKLGAALGALVGVIAVLRVVFGG